MSLRTVEEWRRAVFRSRTVPGKTQVFLLYMADHMRQDRTVTRSQRRIAADLAVSPRAVQGYLQQAVDAGFLSRVQRARKDRSTAVYQGLFPAADAGMGGDPGVPTRVGTPSSAPTQDPGVPTPKGDSGDPGVPALLRRPTGDATSPQSGGWPTDRTGVTGTPADQRGPVPPADGKQSEQCRHGADMLDNEPPVPPWEEEELPPDPRGDR